MLMRAGARRSSIQRRTCFNGIAPLPSVPSLYNVTNRHYSSTDGGGLVKVEEDVQENSIAIVKLNRPDKLNALSVELGVEFQDKVTTLREKHGLKCVILTGEGKAFSAGGDLDFILERTKTSADNNSQIMLDYYKRFLSIRTLGVPVISAINGAAIGAGLCLALATDIRVSYSDAVMSFNFSRLGLHPGMGVTHFLPLAIGPEKATKLLVTGETFKGERALQYGLISELVQAREEVQKRSLEIARGIVTTCSSSSVRMLVRTLRTGQEKGLQEALLREADAQAHSYASPDILEGVNSIREKRNPHFN